MAGYILYPDFTCLQAVTIQVSLIDESEWI